jgi:hypothetical protein
VSADHWSWAYDLSGLKRSDDVGLEFREFDGVITVPVKTVGVIFETGYSKRAARQYPMRADLLSFTTTI